MTTASMTAAHVARKLKLARAAAQRLTTEAGGDTAFVAGSITAGLGNSTSDADVFVVLDDNSGKRTRQILVGTDRVDVEYVRRGDLDALAERLLSLSPTRGNITGFPSESDMDMLVRLRYAEPVAESPWLVSLRDRLESQKRQLRRLAIMRWTIVANAEVEDLTGMYLAGDLAGAALVGRNVAVAAGKAVAAANDDLYIGQKWVLAQLARSAPSGFPHSRLRRFLRGEWADTDEKTGFRDLLNFTQTCLVAAAATAWQEQSIESWPVWISGDSGLYRVPTLLPFRYTDTVVLNHELHRQLEFSPEAALVWGLCNGTPADSIVDHVISLKDTDPAYADLTPSRCRELLNTLVEHRLITEDVPADSGLTG